MSSPNDESDSDPEPKRRKRAPMSYKLYLKEDGTEHIPRTTRLRLDRNLLNLPSDKNKNFPETEQFDHSVSSSQSDTSEKRTPFQEEYICDSEREPESGSGSKENSCLWNSTNQHQSNLESRANFDEEELSENVQGSEAISSSKSTSTTSSESSVCSDGAKSPDSSLSDSSDDLSCNSEEKDEASDGRPTIKLGDFEYLRKKHKLDDPLLPNVVSTSRFETLFMILNFALQEGLSYVGIESLLQLINQVFGQCVIPTSLRIFRSLFDCNLGMSYHIYCPDCKCYIGTHSSLKKKGNNFLCPVSSCKRPGTLTNMNNGNFFISLSLESQLRVFLETKENIQELLTYRFKREQSHSSIRDVFDGELYRKLSGPSGILNNPNNLSITLNTDGSPIFKSVKNTMWPIQCRLNELPPQDRFSSENMFVCGIWYGREEPNMNLFLSEFVKESCQLYHEGFQWTLDGKAITSHVVTLNACLDSRAKPDVQCHKQLHSYDGCSYCFHPGDLVDLKANKVVSTNGSSSEEDFDSEDSEEAEAAQPVGQPKKKTAVKAVRYCVSTGGFYCGRSDRDMREDMMRSDEDGKVHRGIKGISVVMKIPDFDMVHGYVIDILHCILLGVVKTCLNLWLDPKFSKKTFSISSKLREIDERLLRLRPPSNISRRPRSLADYIHFKGNELRAWLFFYSLICLKGILNDVYFKHFSLLVSAMAILCSECISIEDLDKAKNYLDLFVSDFEKLYGPAFMVHNIHITSHLATVVKYSGPSWSHSAFSFESGNGVLTNLVKGTVGVMSQIARKYMTYRCTPLFLNHFTVKQDVLTYCESLVPKRMSKEVSRYDSITLLGSAGIAPLSRQQKEVLSKSKLPCLLSCHYRFIKSGIVYHSLNYPKQGKKSFDSAVKLKDGTYATIERVFVHEEKVYVILRSIVLENDWCVARHEGVGAKCTHIKVCALYPFGSLRVERAAELISKCLLLKHGHCNYIAEFPNVFEKD